MLVRSAFWVGRPRAGQTLAFADLMNGELIPAMAAFPGVREVFALWPQASDVGAPDIWCQVVVRFDSPAERDRMLNCPERLALKPKVLEAVAMFEGSFTHIDYTVGSA